MDPARAAALRRVPPPRRGWSTLAVFAGGMLGGTTRYLIGLAIPAQPGEIPWAILGVNLVGAFVMGLLLHGWVRRGHVSHPWRPFLATGILGSFTTWSTFMADTYRLFVDGAEILAAVYVVGATALGIGAAGARMVDWRSRSSPWSRRCRRRERHRRGDQPAAPGRGGTRRRSSVPCAGLAWTEPSRIGWA